MYVKVLGCVCVGILAYHFNDRHLSTQSELFFYLMCVTFLVCTTILLISCLISWSTGGIISKTIYVSFATIVLIWFLIDSKLTCLLFLFCFSRILGSYLSFCCCCADSCVSNNLVGCHQWQPQHFVPTNLQTTFGCFRKISVNFF